MKRRTFLGIAFLLGCLYHSTVYARVKLPDLIASNMVLQRGTTVSLWGWADPGEKFSISCSWLKAPVRVVADQAGAWRVAVATTNSTKPQSIQISTASQVISLDNILFGEVWLCSGQSNMEMPVSGFQAQPAYGSQETIVNAGDEDIRLFTVEKTASLSPENMMGPNTGWKKASPESVANFSAIGYYFGKHLHDILKVPVGLIHSSWGGSIVEAWMSKESLSPIKEIDLKNVDLKRGNRFPTVLFNAMIQPLLPYTIKGAIWYQGEGNVGQAEQYKLLFPAMVKDWRARWGIGDFPFYYVQIAPFRYGQQNRMTDPNNAALLREAQAQCLDLIPNSGMAVTMDIGTERVIHPPNKKEVADRLLYNALHKTYGYHSIEFSGPMPDTISIKDKGIYVSFKHAEKGLYASGKLDGFEIAGNDKIFYPAEAAILQANKVFVKSDKVQEPVAVRYAFRSWVVGTLFNNYFLPATSFRTDNWTDAKQAD